MLLPRRVVTLIEPQGESRVLFDGGPRVHLSPDVAGEVEIVELWSTPSPIRLPAVEQDPTLKEPDFIPSPGETRFRLVKIAPTKHFDLHQALHRDNLVEYLVILSGQIHLILPSGVERVISAGECVVQQGTEHAWCNRSDDDCLIAVIVIGTEHSD